MNMINFMIPLVASWLPLWNYYIIYFLALAVVAWVGCLLHSLFRR